MVAAAEAARDMIEAQRSAQERAAQRSPAFVVKGDLPRARLEREGVARRASDFDPSRQNATEAPLAVGRLPGSSRFWAFPILAPNASAMTLDGTNTWLVSEPGSDLAVVIGGDGTMLNIARALAPHDVALVGVNQGRLGFLTDISVDNMIATIGAILDGRFVAEERMLLEGKVHRGGKQVLDSSSFIDVVIS